MKKKELKDQDEVKASAPWDDLLPPWDNLTRSPPLLPPTSCSSAATEGIERLNAPIGPAKSCRREETSCQKLPSSSLEILSLEAVGYPVGGQNNGNAHQISIPCPFGFKLIQSFSKKTKTNWEIGKKPILKNLKVLTVSVKVKYSDPES